MDDTFCVLFPLPNHKSIAMFVSFSVLNHTPTHPNHHIENVPGSTTVLSISSFSHVPHSGKAPKIQDSLVISFTFGMITSFVMVLSYQLIF